MADASEALTAFVTDDFLKEFEKKFNDEKAVGEVNPNTTFQYACCLVRSRLNSDVKKGVLLLEDLVKGNKTARTLAEADESNKPCRRDCFYYLATAHARLKNYNEALKHVKILLQTEPGNRQAQNLEKEIRKAMDTEALKGAAVIGGAALAGAALVGLGMAFLGRKH
jgi:fission 1 protein